MIIVAATHRGSQTQLGIRMGERTEKSLIAAGHVCCPEEAIVRAWTHAATALRGEQTAFRFIVQRRLLEGYFRLGWRVRSLPMLRALREFARATQGMSVDFVYRTGSEGRAAARRRP